MTDEEGRQPKGEEEEICDVEHNKTRDYKKEGGVLSSTTDVCGGWREHSPREGEPVEEGDAIHNV